MIILLRNPQHAGFSACHGLERSVLGYLKTGGLRITEIGSNFEKWLLIPTPLPPQLTLPHILLPAPSCSVFSSTGKQPNKTETGGI